MTKLKCNHCGYEFNDAVKLEELADSTVKEGCPDCLWDEIYLHDTEQTPIEKHYGASSLVSSSWGGESLDDWITVANKLHGASLLAADVDLASDLIFLVEIAYKRREMLRPDWRAF